MRLKMEREEKEALFTVGVVINGEGYKLGYSCIDELMTDMGLKTMFDQGHVEECRLLGQGGKYLTVIPVLSWKRLLEGVASNASTILSDSLH